MPSPFLKILAVAGASAALALPGSASGAYAPVLAIQVSPVSAGAAPAIVSTITQANGEAPSKKVVVDFPRGYSANLAVKLGVCSAAQEQANSCPDSSRMGSGSAQASLMGLPQSLDGNVYFGGVTPAGFKLIVILSNPLLGTQTIEGLSTYRPDGTIETVFDNLPNVLTTSFKLSLDGGEHSLLLNPAACGSYLFVASFTSQSGDSARSQANVAITGCPSPLSPPAIGSLTLTPRLVRAGGRARLRFTLNRAVTVRIAIRRVDRRHTRTPARTKRIELDGVAGANDVANVAGGLAPGRYLVSATTGSSPPSAATTTLIVRPRARGRHGAGRGATGG